MKLRVVRKDIFAVKVSSTDSQWQSSHSVHIVFKCSVALSQLLPDLVMERRMRWKSLTRTGANMYQTDVLKINVDDDDDESQLVSTKNNPQTEQ